MLSGRASVRVAAGVLGRRPKALWHIGLGPEGLGSGARVGSSCRSSVAWSVWRDGWWCRIRARLLIAIGILAGVRLSPGMGRWRIYDVIWAVESRMCRVVPAH